MVVITSEKIANCFPGVFKRIDFCLTRNGVFRYLGILYKIREFEWIENIIEKRSGALANHKSAIKRNQQNARRRMQNRVVKKQVKTAVRKFEAARKSGGETTGELRAAQSMLDKAGKKGAVHKRKASRKISRLARRV